VAGENPYAPPAEEKLRPASRAVSGVLSFLLPGLGHGYVGYWMSAGIWFGLDVSLVAVFGATARWWPGKVLLPLLLFAIVGVRIVATVAAIRSARGRSRQSIVTVIVAGVAMFVASRGAAFATRAYLLEGYKIPSGAMAPTLLLGDNIFVDKSIDEPRAGDVIVFEFPANRRQSFVSRVVGLPGQVVEIRDGELVVDGRAAPRCELGPVGLYGDQVAWVEWLGGRPHLLLFDQGRQISQGPWTVAAGEYFVMGDNRNNAHDSRSWNDGRGGGVPASHLAGVAWSVWWSATDPGARFGTDVEAVVLPPNLASLQQALDACLARPPG
jgi:signal peptidase I